MSGRPDRSGPGDGTEPADADGDADGTPARQAVADDGAESPPVGALSDAGRPVVGPVPDGAQWGMVAGQMEFSHYPNLLPAPKAFAAYEQTKPGAADWVMRQVEKETDHRQKLELMEAERVRDASRTQNTVALRAQPYAFGVAIAAMGGGGAAAAAGWEAAGVTAMLGGVGVVVAAFLANGRVSWRGLTRPARRPAATDGDAGD